MVVQYYFQNCGNPTNTIMTIKTKLTKSLVLSLICVTIFELVITNRYFVKASSFVTTPEPTADVSSCHAKLGIRSVAFSPDSQLALASWSLGQARLWNIKTGNL